jgi:hypothetical protein
MLTINVSNWKDGETRRVQAIEIDTEYGSVQAFGPAEISRDRDGLKSGATGGCYSEPQVVAGMVEVWSVEGHYLAVFGDEPSMIAGAHLLATTWAAILPASIYLALIRGLKDAR